MLLYGPFFKYKFHLSEFYLTVFSWAMIQLLGKYILEAAWLLSVDNFISMAVNSSSSLLRKDEGSKAQRKSEVPVWPLTRYEIGQTL